jgi:hypothetical protein
MCFSTSTEDQEGSIPVPSVVGLHTSLRIDDFGAKSPGAAVRNVTPHYNRLHQNITSTAAE